MPFNDSPALQTNELTFAICDFAGYRRAFAGHGDLAMANLMNEFYSVAFTTIHQNGGRVLKFMGDACLAVFEGNAGAVAARTMLELRRRTESLTKTHGIDLVLNARVHTGAAVEGLFGPAGSSQYDVIGHAVNTTALMGGSTPDVWISEPVYQALDKNSRTRWEFAEQGGGYRHIHDST